MLEKKITSKEFQQQCNYENPSIGIILCAEKDHLEVELALQDINKPIGVAEYQYLLPKNKLQELVANEMKDSSNDDD